MDSPVQYGLVTCTTGDFKSAIMWYGGTALMATHKRRSSRAHLGALQTHVSSPGGWALRWLCYRLPRRLLVRSLSLLWTAVRPRGRSCFCRFSRLCRPAHSKNDLTPSLGTFTSQTERGNFHSAGLRQAQHRQSQPRCCRRVPWVVFDVCRVVYNPNQRASTEPRTTGFSFSTVCFCPHGRGGSSV